MIVNIKVHWKLFLLQKCIAKKKKNSHYKNAFRMIYYKIEVSIIL